MQHLPPFIAPSEHHDADSALAQIQHIYQHSVNHLRQAMREFVAGADMADTRVRAFYPFVRVQVTSASRRPEGPLLDVIATHSLRHHVMDMARLCQESGTLVSAVMLGAIAGSGLLPFSREHYESVLAGPSKAAQASLRGFASAFDLVTWGRFRVERRQVERPASEWSDWQI